MKIRISESWKFVPGLVAMVLLALVSDFLSKLIEVGGKHPLEASALAVLIGVLLRGGNLIPPSLFSGIRLYDKILIYGIVLLGATLNFGEITSHGANIIIIIALTMIIGFIGTLLIGRMMGLSTRMAILLASGTTICGTTAIAITAPLIGAKEEETGYSVAVIAFWGLLAILIYPKIGMMVGASDVAFGIFAGTAIHSTPQVVGAGYIFSNAAGRIATAVKLVRNCFIAPLALILAFYFKRKEPKNSENVLKKAFPWFLFGYFAMAILATKGVFSTGCIENISTVGKYLILLSMAGIGMSCDLRGIIKVGIKPLLVGFWGATVVAMVSMISLYFLGS